MATSIQIVGNRSETFNDLDLLVLLHLMIRSAEANSGDKGIRRKLAERFASVCEGYGPGTIDLQLDVLLSDQTLKSEFLRILSETESHIESVGETYPAQLLRDKWRTAGVKIGDYKTNLIRTVAEKVRTLLR